MGERLRGASAPSFQNLPPLLIKERGTQVEDSSRGEVTKIISFLDRVVYDG
jgi:hypothetical protein